MSILLLRSRVEEKPVNKMLRPLFQLLAFLIVAMREAIVEVHNRARMAAFAADQRAFTNSLIGAAIGVTILAIVAFSVSIPVIQNSIATSNLTGTALVIAHLIPTFIVLGVFVIVVAIFVTRWL